jgi:serine/threonine protein kinase
MADQFRDACLQIVESRGIIDGRFTEIHRIGTSGGNGCFSLVFSAYDGQTKRQVALKFYRPDKLGESYRWESFRREAQLLEELAGQQDIVDWVAPLSSFQETMTSAQGVPFPISFSYYAMELAMTDMEVAIASADWHAGHLLTAFRCMCRAAQRIHSQRIAHRDIKPGNFLITEKGQVKLSDFGTARRFDTVSRPLLLAYTYPQGDWLYAAPEILAGLHDVDPEHAFGADFFSLGAILFELFSGTKLGHHLSGQGLHDNLCIHFGNVKPAQRKSIYNRVVNSISDGYPLPRMGAQGPGIPTCIRDRVDDLYRQLAALNYHKRLVDFPGIFRRIDACILILKHEEKYRRWREQKERFRVARDAKRDRRERLASAIDANGVRK